MSRKCYQQYKIELILAIKRKKPETVLQQTSDTKIADVDLIIMSQ